MILEAEQVAIPGGGPRTNAIDLRSRRLKALVTDDAWQPADLRLRGVPNAARGDLLSTNPLVDSAGTEKTIADAEAETFYVLDPNDMEGIDWLIVDGNGTPQGVPAGFAVIPNSTNFSVGAPVTFTVTVFDGVEGLVGVDHVSLTANYADVDALVAALAIKSPSVDDWTNDSGAVTADYSGNLNSYIDVTEIVDASDKMNFSSIIGFAFPGYADDAYITLITEPRT